MKVNIQYKQDNEGNRKQCSRFKIYKMMNFVFTLQAAEKKKRIVQIFSFYS